MTFNDLITPLLPYLRSIANWHSLSKEDGEDALQETLLALWKKFEAGKIDPTQNFTSFCLQQMHWRTKDVCRTKQFAANTFSQVGEENDMDELAHKRVVQSDAAEILEFARNNLRPQEFEIFADHFVENKPVAETMERLSLDRSQVYLTRHRSMRKLRKKYATTN
jgi:RNA polymerase sigma factor (sigma-70 family)